MTDITIIRVHMSPITIDLLNFIKQSGPKRFAEIATHYKEKYTKKQLSNVLYRLKKKGVLKIECKAYQFADDFFYPDLSKGYK